MHTIDKDKLIYLIGLRERFKYPVWRKLQLVLPKYLDHIILYCTVLQQSHAHSMCVLLMIIPQELCHQPEVNTFLNIVTPLPAGSGSLCMCLLTCLLPMRENWRSAQLALIYTSLNKKRSLL